MLLVEDHAATRLVCRLNLEVAGMRVIEAADGGEGLERARTDAPDVILLDLVLGGKSGWEVASELTADPATSGIPIVFFTGRTSSVERLRAFDIGAAGYIVKPFDPTTLAERITALLDRLERDEDVLLAEIVTGATGRSSLVG